MIEQAPRRSRELFESGYGCAEAVLLAMAESMRVESALIPEIATGFCSGIARSGGLCGAVAGGIMGIGLGSGRTLPAESVERNYSLVTELLGRFEKKHGAINCRQLTGCNLATEEGVRTYNEGNLGERCKLLVEDATSIAVSIGAE